MIAKITKGKGFRGLAEYLAQTPHGERRGQLLATNMSGSTPREWAKEFGLVRRMRPTLGKAVFHASLSPSPDDPPLTDEDYRRVARQFLDGMGFPGDAPYICVKHVDQSHPHIHIAACRVTPTGDVVSDARDFQRAEAIVREIEARHGLRAVVPSRVTQKKRQRARKGRGVMENLDERLRRQDEEGKEIEAEHMKEDERREQRRKLLDDAYRDFLRQLYGDEIAFIRRNHKRKSLHVKFKDGSSLTDFGDSLRIACKDDATAARRLVAAAIAKGWTAMTIRGNDVFVKAVMREAMQNGIQVVPTDATQVLMLDELLRERSGVAGAVSAQPAPTPTASTAPAQPQAQTRSSPPPIDMGKLAAMRQQRNGQKSGPKMRRR